MIAACLLRRLDMVESYADKRSLGSVEKIGGFKVKFECNKVDGAIIRLKERTEGYGSILSLVNVG